MKFRNLLQEPPLAHRRTGAASSDPEPGCLCAAGPGALTCCAGPWQPPVGPQHHCSRSCPSLPPWHIPVCLYHCCTAFHEPLYQSLCPEGGWTAFLGTERQNSGHRGWFGSLLTGTPTSLQRNSTRVQAVHLPRSQQPAKGA